MTKDELITKQQLEIENYKRIMNENSDIIRNIKMRFIAIGQPLNDNVLMFNKDQLRWCGKTFQMIETLISSRELSGISE
jgi:hypothetical protein